MAKQSVQQVVQNGENFTSILFEVKAKHGEQLNGRFEKAARLFQRGAVSYLGENEWLVDSESQPGTRHTVRFNIKWYCDCKDCEYGAPVLEFYGGFQKTCAHIAASLLSWLIDSPEAATQPHPAPALSLPAWLIAPAVVAHDAADMGIAPRASDTALPAWFGQAGNIEDHLG